MKAKTEKISAITLKVSDMEASLRFYRDVLGMELLYGGPTLGFFSMHCEYRVSDYQLATGPHGWSLGPNDISRRRCRCLLDSH
jgi:catechol 2,3-dioxygenase-like lactoylglutathione lyase family enzyme